MQLVLVVFFFCKKKHLCCFWSSPLLTFWRKTFQWINGSVCRYCLGRPPILKILQTLFCLFTVLINAAMQLEWDISYSALIIGQVWNSTLLIPSFIIQHTYKRRSDLVIFPLSRKVPKYKVSSRSTCPEEFKSVIKKKHHECYNLRVAQLFTA